MINIRLTRNLFALCGRASQTTSSPYVATTHRTWRDPRALPNQQLMHFGVLMALPGGLAQLCQLMPDEIDGEGNAEDCLGCKDAQELLAAVGVLGLLELECQEDDPQGQQHANLRQKQVVAEYDMHVVCDAWHDMAGRCWLLWRWRRCL